MSNLPSKKIRDKTGQTFGKVFVKEFAGLDKKGKATWNCVCSCGKEMLLDSSRLNNKNNASCHCSRIINSKGRRKYGETTLNAYYGNHKRRGVFENLDYLSKEEWLNIVKQNCHYCNGMEIKTRIRSYFKHSAKFLKEDVERYKVNIVGVDRKDSSKGYTIENSLPCCAVCNRMKMELSYDDYLKKIEEIYNHRILKSKE